MANFRGYIRHVYEQDAHSCLWTTVNLNKGTVSVGKVGGWVGKWISGFEGVGKVGKRYLVSAWRIGSGHGELFFCQSIGANRKKWIEANAPTGSFIVFSILSGIKGVIPSKQKVRVLVRANLARGRDCV